MTAPRFALYFTPAPASPLARFGAEVLGYDCDTGAPVARRKLDGIDGAAAAAATAEPVGGAASTADTTLGGVWSRMMSSVKVCVVGAPAWKRT